MHVYTYITLLLYRFVWDGRTSSDYLLLSHQDHKGTGKGDCIDDRVVDVSGAVVRNGPTGAVEGRISSLLFDRSCRVCHWTLPGEDDPR